MWTSSKDVTREGERNSRVENSQTNSKDNSDGSKTFTWTFTTSSVYFSSFFEVRSLSVNGVALNIPFIRSRYSWANDSRVTNLPCGAVAKVTVRCNGGDPNKRDYTVEISNANRDMVVTSGSINSVETSYREVVISRLYGVDLEVWYTETGSKDSRFDWREVRQSASLRVGNNVQITDDNVFNFDYTKFGASEDSPYQGNIRFRLKLGFGWPGGSITESSGAVQFQEKMGSWSQSFGASGTAIQGPDAQGWYYTTIRSMGDICLLTVQAQPKQYQVRYQDGVNIGGALNPELADSTLGTTTVTNMPAFLAGASEAVFTENNADTNRGSYYSMVNSDNYGDSLRSDRITIPGTTPRATIRQGGYIHGAVFAGWVVTDDKGNAYKWTGSDYSRNAQGQLETTTNPEEFHILNESDTAELSTLTAAAQILGTKRQDNVICLTAYWIVPTPSFSYYVTFNYTDAGGNTHPYAQSGIDPNTEDDDVYLTKDGTQYPAVARRDVFFRHGENSASVVFHSQRNETALSWLATHPWQKYDLTRNGSKGCEGQFFWENTQDNGEVDVWFTTSLGRLTVTKEVVGLDDDFTFEISFTLPAEDDPGTLGNETKFFGDSGPYSVSYTGGGGKADGQMDLTYDAATGYTGTFSLRNGQSIQFDLPAGTRYTITEEDIDGYSTKVTCKDGTTYSDGEDSGWMGTIENAAAPGPYVTFINTGDRLVARKIAHHYYCAPTMDSVEAAGGDPITYTVEIKNPMENDAEQVVVTDQLQEGLVVDPDKISDGGVWDESSRTITWTLDNLPACSYEDLSFAVMLPIVEKTTTFANSVTVSYGAEKTVTSNTVTVTAHPYWLRIAKVVEGSGGDRTKLFTFRVELTVPDGAELQESYPYAYDTGNDLTVHMAEVTSRSSDGRTGVIEVRLHHGESVMIYELPKDTEYRVTEIDGEGYKTTLLLGALTGRISNERDEVLFQNFKGASDIILTKRVNGADEVTANIGETLTYTITAVNTGDAPADHVVVTDTIPEGLKLVEGSISDGGIESDGTITWNLDALAAEGGSQEVSFQVTVPGITSTTVWTNTASVAAGEDTFFSNEATVTARPPASPGSGVDQWLDAKNHDAYLHGYPDGRFGPDDAMTRAEAAQMFYNLLLDKTVPEGVRFDDVDENSWYAPAVRTLSGMGIILGYGNGRFGPNDTLTRAQLVTMAMRFSKGEEGTCDFTDVPETHWAYPYIAGAVRYGWIKGYGDGRFGPDDPLTRAQATAIVNRMLGREADMDFISKHIKDMKTYPDLLPEHWAYGDILEASNGHRYAIRNSVERWARLQ